MLQKHSFLILSLILLTSCTSPEQEASSKPELPDGTLEIRDAWARTADQGMMGGAYLTIANGTKWADTLLSISSDAASTAEIHESYETGDGISGMRPAGKIPLEAESLLELKPGSYHIMLMGLNRELAVGDSVSVTLFFSRHDSIPVQIPVRQKNSDL